MMSDIEQYRKLAQPPAWALSKITGGRLRGMTDIKPAWRIQAMTEVYGLCGIGWKYEVVKQWTEPGSEGQVFAFVDVLLYVKRSMTTQDGVTANGWSEPIPGTGGSMLVAKEKEGLYSNDEAFKMATTDALSSAMKMIGMGADVYAGQWSGSKYSRNAEPQTLGEDEQKYINETTEEINNEVKTIEDLQAVGERLKKKSAAIQNALRPIYAKRLEAIRCEP